MLCHGSSCLLSALFRQYSGNCRESCLKDSDSVTILFTFSLFSLMAPLQSLPISVRVSSPFMPCFTFKCLHCDTVKRLVGVLTSEYFVTLNRSLTLSFLVFLYLEMESIIFYSFNFFMQSCPFACFGHSYYIMHGFYMG